MAKDHSSSIIEKFLEKTKNIEMKGEKLIDIILKIILRDLEEISRYVGIWTCRRISFYFPHSTATTFPSTSHFSRKSY